MASGRGLGAGLGKPQDGQAIYAGAALIGFMFARDHGWDAVTAKGAALGRFNTESAAATALIVQRGKDNR